MPLQTVNSTLAEFRRGASGSRALAPQVTFTPGLQLLSDPALALSGRGRSPEGWLLELDLKPQGVGGWCGLFIDLPPLDLTDRAAFGFVARGATDNDEVINPCLRSGQDEGFNDVFFDRHILMRPEETAHVDALPLPLRPAVPAQAPWRQLVLFLPLKPFTLGLIDLRVFIA